MKCDWFLSSIVMKPVLFVFMHVGDGVAVDMEGHCVATLKLSSQGRKDVDERASLSSPITSAAGWRKLQGRGEQSRAEQTRGDLVQHHR